MENKEQRVRERAFRIWIEEGQPEGKSKEHWERAEKEIGGSDSSSRLNDGGEGKAPTEGEVHAA